MMSPVEKRSGSSGTLVVVVIVLIVILVGGGMILYNRPKNSGALPATLTTSTGLMMLVQGGRFLHGEGKETAIAPAFYIDRTEVTNGSYAKFCQETNRMLPANFPADRLNHPVVNINIGDATTYARWAGKRLPDALEWEKAARGADAKPFPWGTPADPNRANVADNPNAAKGVMPADSLFDGASPYLALHMIGNVAEFVRDTITPSEADRQAFASLIKPPMGNTEPWFSIRGGSFRSTLKDSVPTRWKPVPARFAADDIGFRCVKDPAR
jgi:formylglycine-generating enzyme required for sulfatase activity